MPLCKNVGNSDHENLTEYREDEAGTDLRAMMRRSCSWSFLSPVQHKPYHEISVALTAICAGNSSRLHRLQKGR